MLAPTLEHAREAAGAAFRFAVAARDRYPAFVEELRERTGHHVPLDRSGILEVALDEEGVVGLAGRMHSGAELLDAAALRDIEPALTTSAAAALHPHDGSVDNRALLQALRDATLRSGVRLLEMDVQEIVATGAGARVRTGDRSIEAGSVVLAAGAWSAGIAGLPRPLAVRPVRGQMVALTARPVRRVVYGPFGYLVPRAAGTLAGSTMEEVGFDSRVSPVGVSWLRSMAETLCPVLMGAGIAESWAGLRPVTPDLLPLIGRDPEWPSLVYACGHSRNGILMAPLTGDCVAALLAGEEPGYDLRPFDPSRFS
jgi:glycine oxidase